MDHLLSALSLAVVVFAATNIDDILLLSAFFSSPAFTARQVIAGQLLGIAVITLVSAACALLAFAVPAGWIGLLGLAPLVLGLRGLWALRRASPAEDADAEQDALQARTSGPRILAVASVTLANGGDNFGVYIPMFSSTPTLIPVYAVVFAVMTGVWCALGYWLVNNPLTGDRIKRYGRVALPFVLIGLGSWILSGALVLVSGQGQ